MNKMSSIIDIESSKLPAIDAEYLLNSIYSSKIVE